MEQQGESNPEIFSSHPMAECTIPPGYQTMNVTGYLTVACYAHTNLGRLLPLAFGTDSLETIIFSL